MHKASTILAAILFSLAPLALSGSTFTDGVFNNADWIAEWHITPASFISFTAGQVASGGNPGQMRETTYYFGDLLADPIVFIPDGTHTAIARHINTAFVYDPSVGGAIAQIAFSLDTIATTPLNGTGLSSLPLIEQNGKYYTATTALQEAGLNFLSPASWTARSFTGALNDWDLTPGVGLPDFSATGAPIRFGYFTTVTVICEAVARGGTVCVPERVADAIDNFSVTVTPEASQIPEPATFVLTGTALVGLLALRRRRRA